MDLELTSTAFEEGEPIPAVHTADGANRSPPLTWSEPPSGTKSLALVCEDPDAPKGTFTHWIAFNIPPETRELAAGIPQNPALSDGTAQGINDMDQIGYAGPAPPRGKPHRYFFKLYALDSPLKLQPGANARDLNDSVQGHLLAESQLMGTYKR